MQVSEILLRTSLHSNHTLGDLVKERVLISSLGNSHTESYIQYRLKKSEMNKLFRLPIQVSRQERVVLGLGGYRRDG